MSDLVSRLKEAGKWIDAEACFTAADEITRLRAELEECKKDAERYRWLLTGENQTEIFGCMWNRLGEAIEEAMSEGGMMKTVAYLHPTASHCVSVDPESYENPRKLVLRSEAAAEIKRLRAENERLRDALRRTGDEPNLARTRAIAAAALAAKGEKNDV